MCYKSFYFESPAATHCLHRRVFFSWFAEKAAFARSRPHPEHCTKSRRAAASAAALRATASAATRAAASSAAFRAAYLRATLSGSGESGSLGGVRGGACS